MYEAIFTLLNSDAFVISLAIFVAVVVFIVIIVEVSRWRGNKRDHIARRMGVPNDEYEHGDSLHANSIRELNQLRDDTPKRNKKTGRFVKRS